MRIRLFNCSIVQLLTKKITISERKRAKGFTLIELLIVIVIIGVLATLLLANFIGVQQRARDSRRKSDLRQIQIALELIRQDTGSYLTGVLYYPSPGTGDCPTSSSLVGGPGLVTYMQKIPCDPSSITFSTNPAGNYDYNLTVDGYELYACIENTNDKDPNVTSVDTSICNTGKQYELTNQ